MLGAQTSTHWTLASGLLMAGIVTIAVTSAGVLVLYMQRSATRQFQDVNPLDPSPGALRQRTITRAVRGRTQTYFVVAMYLLGVGLLAASAIAKLTG